MSETRLPEGRDPVTICHEGSSHRRWEG
ncbi:hypothetical protein BJ991_000107 [Microbacterium immunditiarum]|uniref:Uncharacterized protein n=1 Tax=Microbacterium immunditiarum TaxID=337480 RepID=A0A7Y9GKE5_9MICO|nr:hypothetical protein [Microbacterium immunditiarum]